VATRAERAAGLAERLQAKSAQPEVRAAAVKAPPANQLDLF